MGKQENDGQEVRPVGEVVRQIKRGKLADRAREATDVIDRLVAAGMTPEKIAEEARVSMRTVYRWWKEGKAPHPILLDGLRKLSLRKGINNG